MRSHGPVRIEVIDDAMADVLRKMSGPERLRIAFGMFSSARRWVTSAVTAEQPGWSVEQIQREVARRLSHGTVTTAAVCGGSA